MTLNNRLNLVDQPHEVSIRPSGLVQVVGLLQHLGQLLAPDVPVIHHYYLHTPLEDTKSEAHVLHANAM